MINRLFFFIRKSTNVQFYHETTNYHDLIRSHVHNIDPTIVVTHGVVNELIHYYKFEHPSIIEFNKITSNMYFDGDLKQEFKKCMRYTKNKQIAFGLAAVNESIVFGDIQRLQYYNVKSDDVTFIDATYSQKVALGLYNAVVGLPELVYTINFFDYTHNVKHVETRLVNTNDVWARLREANDRECPNFMLEKTEHNKTRNIIEGKSSELNTHPIKEFRPIEVVDFMDVSLSSINLNLSI